MEKDGAARADFVFFVADFDVVGVFLVAKFGCYGLDTRDDFFETIVAGGAASVIDFTHVWFFATDAHGVIDRELEN